MSVILYEKKNGIGIITLNRPEKRNALNSAMINGLGQYLHEAADDSDVKVIVIRAEGEKAFTAGFDLKESMEHNITDIVERRADTKSEVDFFLYMWYLPKPIISAVQGYCIGGGITIAMMNDLVIAGRLEPDQAKRIEIYTQLVNLINDEAVSMPLYQEVNTALYRVGLKNVTADQAVPVNRFFDYTY